MYTGPSGVANFTERRNTDVTNHCHPELQGRLSFQILGVLPTDETATEMKSGPLWCRPHRKTLPRISTNCAFLIHYPPAGVLFVAKANSSGVIDGIRSREAGSRGWVATRASTYMAMSSDRMPRLKHTGIYGVCHPEAAFLHLSRPHG